MGNAQIGIGYIAARPDYVTQTYQGFAAYADFDFRPHLGIEAEFHPSQQYNRLQELPAHQSDRRPISAYGPVIPWIKAMIGRGGFE